MARAFALTAAVLVILTIPSGCKTGGSMPSLSWWPGAGGSNDNAKLAAAPSSDSKVEKPSQTQSPYPTTSTPEGYAVAGGQQPNASAPSVALPSPTPAVAPASMAPVTYGSTPPPAAMAGSSAPPPQVSTATPPANGPAPQVGAYQGWPAGGTSPAAATAASAYPTTAPGAADPSPPVRYADARGATSGLDPVQPVQPAAPPVAPPASAPPVSPSFSQPPQAPAQAPAQAPDGSGPLPDSRYSAAGSRFGGAEASVTPAVPPEAAYTPSAIPAAAPPAPAQPTRRPDPGYRPGGTSTYRPSQAIVDEPEDSAPVRRASFDAPAG